MNFNLGSIFLYVFSTHGIPQRTPLSLAFISAKAINFDEIRTDVLSKFFISSSMAETTFISIASLNILLVMSIYWSMASLIKPPPRQILLS